MIVPRRVYTKFFHHDWLGNTRLKRCSLAGRAVWVDMICLMAQCDEVGVLATGGEPWSDEDVVRSIAGPADEITAALLELERLGILKRRESDGAIFSQRMIDDEERSKVRSEAGSKGGKQTLKQMLKQKGAQKGAQVCQANAQAHSHSPESIVQKANPEPNPNPDQENTSARTQPKIGWSEPDSFEGITDDHRSLWAKAYPACDLDRQLAAMDAWLRANPRQAKKSNWSKFITGWLSRSQDRGGDARNENGKATGTNRATQAESAADRRADKASREYPEPVRPLPIFRS